MAARNFGCWHAIWIPYFLVQITKMEKFVNKVKIGAEVYAVTPNDKKYSFFSKVTKIGGKWAELASGHRFEINAVSNDGWRLSPGTVSSFIGPGAVFIPVGCFLCFFTEQDYLDKIARQKDWAILTRSLPAYPPKGISLEDIHKIAEIAGIGDKFKQIMKD
jgi:hypothetical protein